MKKESQNGIELADISIDSINRSICMDKLII